MGWRSIIIANPATLSLSQNALVITQEGNVARIMLEDINVLLLEHAQVSLTVPLLSALAEAQIAVITVNASHVPNGILMPYLPHSRALKVMHAQMAMSQPDRKRLWQRLVFYKISNQACVLKNQGLTDDALALDRMANQLRSGDPDNAEAKAANLYFRHVFQCKFNRSQSRFYNAALNYGYAIIRGAIARSLTAYGFLPAFGLFHHNEQNAFNLADDLIEPYRPVLDAFVLQQFPVEPGPSLETADKAALVQILHNDVPMTSYRGVDAGQRTVLAAIDATVTSLSSIVMRDLTWEQLALPNLNHDNITTLFPHDTP